MGQRERAESRTGEEEARTQQRAFFDGCDAHRASPPELPAFDDAIAWSGSGGWLTGPQSRAPGGLRGRKGATQQHGPSRRGLRPFFGSSSLAPKGGGLTPSGHGSTPT